MVPGRVEAVTGLLERVVGLCRVQRPASRNASARLEICNGSPACRLRLITPLAGKTSQLVNQLETNTRSRYSVACQADCGPGRAATARPQSPSRQNGAGQLGAARSAAGVWAQVGRRRAHRHRRRHLLPISRGTRCPPAGRRKAGGPAAGRTASAGRRRSGDGVQRELAAVDHVVDGAGQRGHPTRSRRLRGTGARPGADRAARDRSTTCNPARSLSPRSPTSGTPPPSATPRPW